MLCLGMHSNVMLRFMVQAFQDPPLCSSTKSSFLTFHLNGLFATKEEKEEKNLKCLLIG
jgi:hypothetical protein